MKMRLLLLLLLLLCVLLVCCCLGWDWGCDWEWEWEWKWGLNKGSSKNGILGGGSISVVALLVIAVFHYCFCFFSASLRPSPSFIAPSISNSDFDSSSSTPSATSQSRQFVSEADLKFLIQNLDDDNDSNPNPTHKWDHVIHKSTNLLSYTAKSSKPKDAPLTYLSLTVFEHCSPELLRDFYMDNHYRKQWDTTLLQHHQLEVDTLHATEFGRTIKKFPLLTPRDYVLAWRLWEAQHPQGTTFYCFIKDSLHPSAPPNPNYVRVRFYRSGWRISKVPGRDACQIKMFHQEDAGLNVEMAKLAFARGIWSYVCKMHNALRKYSTFTGPQKYPAVTSLSLMHKVPAALEAMDASVDAPSTYAATATNGLVNGETKRKFPRRPSKKVLTNGLLLLGGVICLSRGHSSLGAKVAMAYILTKLRKRDASSSRSGER